MKIAITGGTGFVGGHLARELVKQGHDVVLVARGIDHRDEDIFRMNKTEYAMVGLNNPENLSFQSARCNQHIQTSMNYFETTEYNCKEEVKHRIDNLFILHKSKEWNEILEQINSFT